MAKGVGTPHTLDTPLVFGMPEAFPLTDLTSESAQEMAAVMQRAWLDFIIEGVPTVAGVEWPPYERERSVKALDSECSVVADSLRVQREARQL